MSVSEELDQWIKEHGNERDALNVALARLRAAQLKLDALYNATLYVDCPCGAAILPGYVCGVCGYDSSVEG